MTKSHFQEEFQITLIDHLLTTSKLRNELNLNELALKVEDPHISFNDRLAYAAVLGILGDPRTPTEPKLTYIKGGVIEIGLDEKHVNKVVSSWAHVGVLESWIRKEVPVHKVVLQDYRIGTYPITNSQYKAFLVNSGYEKRPKTWYLGAYPWDRGNHPVSGIDPEDAEAYIKWLSQLTGKSYRLPSEAEWEHAAKGFDNFEYPWGNTFDPKKANVRESNINTTTPVGLYPMGCSPFGVFDMAGNVEEYVADDYSPYPCGIFVKDDLAEAMGRYRITRGGSFARFGDLARTRRRHGNFPSPLYPIGFRVACDIEYNIKSECG